MVYKMQTTNQPDQSVRQLVYLVDQRLKNAVNAQLFACERKP